MTLTRSSIAALAVAALSLTTIGCTDAMQSKIGAYGDSARVTCYSGGELVFDDFSTGKVQSEESSDGWYFRSVTTQRLISMAGDCRIDYGAKAPVGWKSTGVGNPVIG